MMSLMSDEHSHATPGRDVVRWVAVVPVKATAFAKTRLLPGLENATPAVIAAALAQDTVEAVRRTPGVDRIFVVTDDVVVADLLAADGTRIVAESSSLPVTAPGFARLNEAFRQGAAEARAWSSTHGVVALTGDLAALHPADLAAALAQAIRYPRSFVADAEGTGTSALLALGSHDLDPHFGLLSAQAHAESGAVSLTGELTSLRRDIDTLSDLAAGADLGLGPHTTALLSGSPGRVRHAC